MRGLNRWLIHVFFPFKIANVTNEHLMSSEKVPFAFFITPVTQHTIWRLSVFNFSKHILFYKFSSRIWHEHKMNFPPHVVLIWYIYIYFFFSAQICHRMWVSADVSKLRSLTSSLLPDVACKHADEAVPLAAHTQTLHHQRMKACRHTNAPWMCTLSRRAHKLPHSHLHTSHLAVHQRSPGEPERPLAASLFFVSREKTHTECFNASFPSN